HLGFDASVLSELVQTLSDLVEDGLGVRVESRQSHVHFVRELVHLKRLLLPSIISSSSPIRTHRSTGDSKIIVPPPSIFSSQLPLVGRQELLESGREGILQLVGLLLIL
ncbi:hypothetical protein PFISCL1PPCAC_13609, partial [Pristionchus fissidentatus]